MTNEIHLQDIEIPGFSTFDVMVYQGHIVVQTTCGEQVTLSDEDANRLVRFLRANGYEG